MMWSLINTHGLVFEPSKEALSITLVFQLNARNNFLLFSSANVVIQFPQSRTFAGVIWSDQNDNILIAKFKSLAVGECDLVKRQSGTNEIPVFLLQSVVGHGVLKLLCCDSVPRPEINPIRMSRQGRP